MLTWWRSSEAIKKVSLPILKSADAPRLSRPSAPVLKPAFRVPGWGWGWGLG